LLVFARAERGHHERLCFTACKQRTAMRTRQHTDFGDDRTHGFQIAPVDTHAGIDNGAAHHTAFQLFEQLAEQVGLNPAFLFAHQCGGGFGFDRIDALVPIAFGCDLVGGLKLAFGVTRKHAKLRFIFVGLHVARLFRALFRKADDGVDHLLHFAVTEHDGARA
jgi:hypothetical protein